MFENQKLFKKVIVKTRNMNENNEENVLKLLNSIEQPFIFPEVECKIIESHIENVIKTAKDGKYKLCTVDEGLQRKKYFFGEGYIYGTQMSKRGLNIEHLYPKKFIDPIPSWIYDYIINPLISMNIIPPNFVNSVTINDYQPGGCIVSHIDPPHIFDRPIVSVSFFSGSALCFGCKFSYKPIRCTEPVLRLPLPRGVVTSISGFAANEITHCVRPADVKQHRAVIILRKAFPNAPRLSESEFIFYKNKNSPLFLTSCVQPAIKMPIKLNSSEFQKFYEQFKKTSKGKRRSGSISKCPHIKKTFFADNKRYADQPYSLYE